MFLLLVAFLARVLANGSAHGVFMPGDADGEAGFRFFGVAVHGGRVMGELSSFVGEWQANEEGEGIDQHAQEPEGGTDDEGCQGAGFWCGAVHGVSVPVRRVFFPGGF